MLCLPSTVKYILTIGDSTRLKYYLRSAECKHLYLFVWGHRYKLNAHERSLSRVGNLSLCPGQIGRQTDSSCIPFTGLALIRILRETSGVADPGERDCQRLTSFGPLSFIFMQFCQKSCQRLTSFGPLSYIFMQFCQKSYQINER